MQLDSLRTSLLIDDRPSLPFTRQSLFRAAKYEPSLAIIVLCTDLIVEPVYLLTARNCRKHR